MMVRGVKLTADEQALAKLVTERPAVLDVLSPRARMVVVLRLGVASDELGAVAASRLPCDRQAGLLSPTVPPASRPGSAWAGPVRLPHSELSQRG
jgi:hypothetical protein